MRRTFVIALLGSCGLLAGSVVAVGVAAAQSDGSGDVTTATVTTADLTRSVTADGTLRAATTWTLSHQADPDLVTTTVANPAAGGAAAGPGGGNAGGNTAGNTSAAPTTTVTEEVPSSAEVTALPDPGIVVPFGGTLYATDDQPTLLLPGTTAAWRTLESGVDDGPDVAQLEAYLVSLGFDAGTVDAHVDAATEAAIEAWQESIGLESTGRVELGSIVFASTPLTIESVSATVSASIGDGSAVLVVRSGELVVDATVDDDLAPYLATGDAVEVRLPGGSVVGATVTAVVDDPERGRIALAALAEVPSLAVTPVPVTVTRTVTLATGVLVVPTESIVHLEGGIDAVRRPDGSLATVKLGAVSGALVAITTTELVENDTIMLP